MQIAVLFATAVVAASASFTDPTGDAGSGPDVTRVEAASSAGGLSFTVHTAAAEAWAEAIALIPLDVGPGGDSGGYDYELTLHSEHNLATMERWTGAAWEPTAERPSFSLDGATLTMGIPLTVVGDPKVVRFEVRTRGPAGGDDAGAWTFSTVKPTFSPAQPVHGRPFAVRGATGCSARLAGKKLAGVCRWSIPASARGKQLVVAAGGKTYRFRVR